MANPQTGAMAVVSICVTAQNEDLTPSTAEALTWVPIGNVGRVGQHGYSTNMLSYPTLDRLLALKAKGITDGGDAEIEHAVVTGDPGQVALAALTDDQDNYAVKVEYANGDVRYLRGPIGGPQYSEVAPESFRTATYTMGLNQILDVPAP